MKTLLRPLAGVSSATARGRSRAGAPIAVAALLALGGMCAAFAQRTESAPDSDKALTALFEPWPDPDSSVDSALVQHRAGTDDELDPLRSEAAAGDEAAVVQLAQELVDRFENTRSQGDLFEAVLWIDRYHGSVMLARSGVIERTSAKHCDQKILHFHWMCASTE